MSAKEQSIFEALLIMAYNVGRSHGETNVMPVAEGRQVVVEQLSKLVEHVDPGDLVLPVKGLITP